MEFIIVAVVSAAVYGWLSNKFKELKEDEFNSSLRQQLAEEKRQFEKKVAEETRQLEQKVAEGNQKLQQREDHLAKLRLEFEAGYLRGRKWLAQFLGEADRVFDEAISSSLRNKKRPALKAAEEVSAARLEKRQIKEQCKFLEYQLKSYKEYFPFLEEYEEIVLDEVISLTQNGKNLEALENADPVLFYVPKIEYEKLKPSARNQLALDRYLKRPLSRAAIGRFYERYLGYLYERDGWEVEYHGIVEGYEDLGRDLICRKGDRIAIIQAKCWASEKLIHEKHIFQLFGTTQLFLMNQESSLGGKIISPILITTTALSPVAKKAAQWLKIEVKEQFAIDKSYPMIKCNINQSSKEKIYHLPFDQQYDRTKITPVLGEFYAATVAEAEREGFRRAFRHLAK